MHMSGCPVGSSIPPHRGSSRTFRNSTLEQIWALVDFGDRHNLDTHHGKQAVDTDPMCVSGRMQAPICGPFTILSSIDFI